MVSQSLLYNIEHIVYINLFIGLIRNQAAPLSSLTTSTTTEQVIVIIKVGFICNGGESTW